MAIVENYPSFFGGTIQITRSNTLNNGYRPFINELEGIKSVFDGIQNYFQYDITHEEEYLRGCAQINDGLINITCSPITFLSTLALAYQYFS